MDGISVEKTTNHFTFFSTWVFSGINIYTPSSFNYVHKQKYTMYIITEFKTNIYAPRDTLYLSLCAKNEHLNLE